MTEKEAAKRNRRKDGKEVANDEMTGEQLLAFLKAALIDALPLKNGGVFYVCSPAGCTEIIFRQALGDMLRECIVWVKDQFVFGRQDYHWRHESILYGWKNGAAHYFVDDRTQDTVWEVDRPRASEEHPTMKPVALVARAIRNSSTHNQIVFDGFSGSGSTLMASEFSSRRFRGLELEPKYADAILKRWEDFTGRKAEKAE